MYDDVLYDLVPTAEPLKYKDPDVDRSLRDLFHGADAAVTVHQKAASDAEKEEQKIRDEIAQGQTNVDEPKRRALSNQIVEEKSAAFSIQMTAETAGEMLGFRDQVGTFTELIERAQRPACDDCGLDRGRPLTGAAALAGKHPKLRAPLISFLRAQLSKLRQSQVSPQQVFECVWRADLRELSPDLEKVATHSPEEDEDGSMYTSPPPPNGSGKFHAARAILTAWRETDPLTKTKLDALINGYFTRGGPIADVLWADFRALPANEQLAFRNFITWLGTADASVSRYLEDVFTPHTPRPKEEPSLRQFWYE